MATASRHPQKRHWCIHQRRRERWAMNRCAGQMSYRDSVATRNRLRKTPRSPVQLPAAIPIDSRGRLLQPDVVVIDHAPGREDHGESVDHQRRIEILQVPGAHHNRRDQQARSTVWPTRRPDAVGGPAKVGRKRDIEGLLPRDEDPVIGPPQHPRGDRQQRETRPDGAQYGCGRMPATSGGKKPPSPPIAPTRPVTVPV